MSAHFGETFRAVCGECTQEGSSVGHPISTAAQGPATTSRLKTHYFKNRDDTLDFGFYLRFNKGLLAQTLQPYLRPHLPIKCSAYVRFVKAAEGGMENQPIVIFRTHTESVLEVCDLDDTLDSLLDILLKKYEEFSEDGSGWRLKKILGVYVMANPSDYVRKDTTNVIIADPKSTNISRSKPDDIQSAVDHELMQRRQEKAEKVFLAWSAYLDYTKSKKLLGENISITAMCTEIKKILRNCRARQRELLEVKKLIIKCKERRMDNEDIKKLLRMNKENKKPLSISRSRHPENTENKQLLEYAENKKPLITSRSKLQESAKHKAPLSLRSSRHLECAESKKPFSIVRRSRHPEYAGEKLSGRSRYMQAPNMKLQDRIRQLRQERYHMLRQSHQTHQNVIECLAKLSLEQ